LMAGQLRNRQKVCYGLFFLPYPRRSVVEQLNQGKKIKEVAPNAGKRPCGMRQRERREARPTESDECNKGNDWRETALLPVTAYWNAP
jgi:hypothetical protein